jgi:hypothetical protein
LAATKTKHAWSRGKIQKIKSDDEKRWGASDEEGHALMTMMGDCMPCILSGVT